MFIIIEYVPARNILRELYLKLFVQFGLSLSDGEKKLTGNHILPLQYSTHLPIVYHDFIFILCYEFTNECKRVTKTCHRKKDLQNTKLITDKT